MPQRAGNPAGGVLGVPGLHPRADALFKLLDDAIGHAGIDVNAGSCGSGRGSHLEKPSVSEMKKSRCDKKPHAFLGETGMKAPKHGGSAVKDCRRGGHRSARSEAEEDREGAAKAAWPDPSRHGGRPPSLNQRTAATQSSHKRPEGACAMRAGVGRKAVPRRGPSEKRARKHAVADQASAPQCTRFE